MFYSKSSLDRADHLRKDATVLKQLRSADNTRLIPVRQGHSLVAEDSRLPLALLLPPQTPVSGTEVFLGRDDAYHYFATDISDVSDESLPAALQHAMDLNGNAHSGVFSDLRAIGPLLGHHEGSLLAYARGMVYWNNHTVCCIRCGHNLVASNGGHVRICSSCNHMVFPRTDPAVIMLVKHTDEHGTDQCLLGRSPAWPTGVFSTLAGFVEPGESLEMAVQREVLEEASIHTEDVRYVASQPWPFPRSIMLGFEARATTTAISCDPTELADAQWFTREQLRTFGSWTDAGDGFKLPRTDSIARHLIDRWIGEESET